MITTTFVTAALMLLLTPGDDAENPWKAQVAPAVQAAESSGTVAALRRALDTAWRADDWETGLQLAERAQHKHADSDELRGMVIRALWRAGRIEPAEALARQVPSDTNDRIALRWMIAIALARGQVDVAGEWSARLGKVGPADALDLYAVFSANFAAHKYAGLPGQLRKVEQLTDAKNGYPEMYLSEAIDGLAKYLDAVGPTQLNQLACPGAVAMTPLIMTRLPSCEVLINGHGPYRMVIDTGGSVMVALDQAVANDVGLRSIAPATVRGVSGTQETGQTMIDELDVGTIKCKRVITRTFDVSAALMNSADGIIGTGIFADGRMTLDFANGQLTVAPSSADAGPGQPVDVRVVGDAKLMALVKVNDEPGVALLDSGADVVALAPSRLRELFPGQPIFSMKTPIAIGVGSDESPEVSLAGGVQLQFAGRTFDNYGGVGLDVLDTILSPIIGIRMDILLGMPTFRQTSTVTVDFPTSRMWIDWLEQ